jgi:hypothetical protein
MLFAPVREQRETDAIFVTTNYFAPREASKPLVVEYSRQVVVGRLAPPSISLSLPTDRRSEPAAQPHSEWGGRVGQRCL